MLNIELYQEILVHLIGLVEVLEDGQVVKLETLHVHLQVDK